MPRIALIMISFAFLILGQESRSQNTGFPRWPLTTSLGCELVDWVPTVPTHQDLSFCSASAMGGTGAAFDCCGVLQFYVLNTGSLMQYQLKAYSNTALLTLVHPDNSPYPTAEQGFEGIAGDNEVQVVRVPGSCTKWFIIYSKYESGHDGYTPTKICYALVEYLTTNPGSLIVHQKDSELLVGGTAYTYVHGKAVSATGPGGDATTRILYACRRSTTEQTLSIDRWIISGGGSPQIVQGSPANTGTIDANWWPLTVVGSNLELNADGTILAVINRNQENSDCAHYPHLVLFKTEQFDNAPAHSTTVCFNAQPLPDFSNNTAQDQALQSGYEYLGYMCRKISGIQFSPNGKYLWFTGGGYTEQGYACCTYLGQLDISPLTPLTLDWSSTGSAVNLPLRGRVQHPHQSTTDDVLSTGQGVLVANDPDYQLVGQIQRSYDGKLYFTKTNSNILHEIAAPDNQLVSNLPTLTDLNLLRPSVDFGGNVTVNGDVGFLPDQIDGFDYVTILTAPIVVSTSNATVNVGGTATLTANQPGGVWSVTPGATPAGAGTITGSTTATFTATAPGNVVVVYTIGSPTGSCTGSINLSIPAVVIDTVTVYKFRDLDGDGQLDTGEPYLPGWTINLTGPGTYTGVTDASGQVVFHITNTGVYTLSEVLKPGWTRTRPLWGTYTVPVPGNASVYYFGNDSSGHAADTVRGYKYFDIDGDGVQDNNEPPRGGWVITLTDNANNTYTATTDPGGQFYFLNRPPGTYTLSETPQAGWIQTQPGTPNAYTVQIPATHPFYVFGNDSLGVTGSLCGVKYNDLDGDGVRDPNELGIPGFQITINDQDTATWTVTTGANGLFCLDNLPAGTYYVSEVNQSGWTQTQPVNPNSYTVVLQAGQTIDTLLFGNHKGDDCDDVIQGSAAPNPFTCTFNFEINNLLGTPVTSIEMMAYDGTFNSLSLTLPPGNGYSTIPATLAGNVFGQITLTTPYNGNIPGSISVTPSETDGWVSIVFTIHHGAVACRDSISWRCCLEEPCDSVWAEPFQFGQLDQDWKTFHIQSFMTSPISWIEIALDPPLSTSPPCPGTHTGGGLATNAEGALPLEFFHPYTRIPSSGSDVLTIGAQHVDLNLGINSFCNWSGDVVFTIHHQDGRICTERYGTWIVQHPGGGKLAYTDAIGKRLMAKRFTVKNTEATANVKWVGVSMQDASDELWSVLAESTPGTQTAKNTASLQAAHQSARSATFGFWTPLRPGETSDAINIVIARDSNATGTPVIRFTTYDENGNALKTDTMSILTSVIVLEKNTLPQDFEILNTYPNPATGTATINFLLGKSTDVRLELYDELGSLVAPIFAGVRDAGIQSVQVNTTVLASGRYVIRLSSGDRHVSQAMVVVK
jgi:hypothetical protein